ncbi:sugar-transfer associated ATP-grasp domain-containing protein [Lachnoclostridium phytofermentans]|uniref:Putative hexapeptide transferase family protein n=1 Tax=Lachnoclostridium phytofermentans (strain ATCC 700394 / DSM 18823 / ISDg) TaxID=357809 RepID=A9KN86_LACP7|nr:sugar-transfer associated ATP-grasp domain-containing protein [Lachnoclostridium phytofermentans]ABX41585.1 putative hexapeptide transferase family protein [Lachnoclostridium phytofermentans ISDg]
MGILKKERALLNHFIDKSFCTGLKVGEYKYIWGYRNLWRKVVLSKKQTNSIQRNFKKYYGKSFSTKWHRFYQSYTGKFDKDYFPEILFSTELEPLLNPRSISLTLEDKNLLEPLYKSVKGLKIPKTLIGNSYGTYYSNIEGKRKIINDKKACDIISNTDYVVIKPTIGTHSGSGIMICKFMNGIDEFTQSSCSDILELYKENFIIQEYITNCKELSSLYGESLNTIRVVTYILDNKLYYLPLALRLGCDGNKVDNIGAGGLFIGISQEGYLNPYAFAEIGTKYSHHPNSKVVFRNYFIPNIPKVLEMAYCCHLKTPQVKMVSWDFTIDESLNVVLIEANMLGQSVGFPQMANGESAFGVNTGRMLKLIRK